MIVSEVDKRGDYTRLILQYIKILGLLRKIS